MLPSKPVRRHFEITCSLTSSSYNPPRAEWTNQSRTNSPLRGGSGPSPAEVSSGTSSHVGSGPGSGPSHGRPRASSHYYEDVDPRFSDVHIDLSPPADPPVLPPSLVPGGPSSTRQLAPPGGLQPSHSDENLQDGARSPTGSEISHFTSVSQRGVNPRWTPGHSEFRSIPPQPVRRPVPAGSSALRDRDVLLQNNPDFEIPGMRPPGRGAGIATSGGGGIGASRTGQKPGGMMPVQMPPNMDMPSNGLTGVGRYPPS